MRCVIVLFNRDVRVHDHPALHEAVAQADTVLPLFVIDDGILARTAGSPNRLSFLLDGLRELRERCGPAAAISSSSAAIPSPSPSGGRVSTPRRRCSCRRT